MCACATTEKALCSPLFSQRSFVCCYESMPAARCYSGSRDHVAEEGRGNTLASMEGGLFQFTDDVVTMAVSQCVTDLLR